MVQERRKQYQSKRKVRPTFIDAIFNVSVKTEKLLRTIKELNAEKPSLGSLMKEDKQKN